MSTEKRWNLPATRTGGVADAELNERRERAALDTPPVDGVPLANMNIGGVECLVAGDRGASRALLHLHGGGFRIGTPRTWTNYATDLAQRGHGLAKPLHLADRHVLHHISGFFLTQ